MWLVNAIFFFASCVNAHLVNPTAPLCLFFCVFVCLLVCVSHCPLEAVMFCFSWNRMPVSLAVLCTGAAAKLNYRCASLILYRKFLRCTDRFQHACPPH